MLEQQSNAAKALIEADLDFLNGYGTFGSAFHLAVMQGNQEVLDVLI